MTARTQPGVTLQGFTSHADFEEECSLCHRPLSTDQTDLCTRCHENIAEQRDARSGTHGQIDQATACRACHPEHKGREYDPVAYAVIHFDHNKTNLPLTGAHAALDCESCHEAGNYQLEYSGCTGCHEEPALHAGLFAAACDTCHTDLDWLPAVIAGQAFDHENTEFSLVRHSSLPDGGDLLCNDCHLPRLDTVDPQTCASCHAQRDAAFMDEHLRIMGEDCFQCHDGTDRMAGFDHATVFPLDGQHGALACAECHEDFHFKGTPAECEACHAEPEIHAGYFGTQCQRCHSVEAWTPAKLTQHTFPLNHGEQGDLECQACHPGTYTQYTCYECHEHQPAEIAQKHREEKISTDELAQCAACHPTGREEEGERGEE